MHKMRHISIRGSDIKIICCVRSRFPDTIDGYVLSDIDLADCY